MIQIDTTILAENYKLFYFLFVLLVFLVVLSISGWILLQLKKNKISDTPIAFSKSLSFLLLLRGITWLAISYLIIRLSLIINLTFLKIFGILTALFLGFGEIILSLGLFAKKSWAEKLFHKVKHFILGPVTDKKPDIPTNKNPQYTQLSSQQNINNPSSNL